MQNIKVKTASITPFEYELVKYLKDLETNEKFSGVGGTMPQPGTMEFVTWLNNQPAAAAYNADTYAAYEKSGTKKTFGDWYKEFANTEEGKGLLGMAKSLFASWVDKNVDTKTPVTDIPTTHQKWYQNPMNILGLSALLLVAGVVIFIAVKKHKGVAVATPVKV